MDRENVVHIHEGILFHSKEKCNHEIYRKKWIELEIIILR